MIIELIPVVVFDGVHPLTASVDVDSLVVNGVVFDFSPLGDGDSLPRAAFSDKWLRGAQRNAGLIHVSLRFPIPPEASYEARFPEPVDVVDGLVPLPWVPSALEEMNEETEVIEEGAQP